MCFMVCSTSFLTGGLLMDYLGIRCTCWVASLLYLVGWGTLSLASLLKIGHIYMAALVLLAMVPAIIYVAGLGSAKMLHDVRHTHYVSASVSLCYEVSPFVIYLLQVCVPSYVSLVIATGGVAVVTAFLSGAMATTHITKKEAREIDEYNGLTSSGENGDHAAGDSEAELRNHLAHPRYILQAIFMVVVNTKSQFYVATFSDQIEYFSTPEETKLSNYLFDVGFSLSPFIAMPFVIIFLGRYRERYDIVFFWLWMMTMAHAILNTWGKESLTCQMIAMTIFFILKPLKWASAAEFIHQPPYKLVHYGRLFGAVSLLCGISAASIYPLTKVTMIYFDGCFFNANLFLTIIEGCIVIFPIYLHFEYHQGWPKSYELVSSAAKSSSAAGKREQEPLLRGSQSMSRFADNDQQIINDFDNKRN
eukprot:jgi/Bigna1/80969/fgenesh1_pg.76_\